MDGFDDTDYPDYVLDSDVGGEDSDGEGEMEADNPGCDDDLGIDMNIKTRTASESEQDGKILGFDYRFEVIEAEKVMQYMCDIIRGVTNVVEIQPTIARTLLNHFKWDMEKLLERYYDGDQEKLFKDAHIVGPSVGAAKVSKATPDERCTICLTDCPNSIMSGLECGHRFCAPCWSQYLTTRIMDHGMGQTISCAAHDCGMLIDDAIVMKLVQDKRVKNRYQHLITNSFVESNKLLRWCPSANCTNAVRVQYPDSKPVRCKCGFVFCFSCGHEWHDPVKCSILRNWVKKCNDDSETSNWLAANTKECPKCHVTVEKDGGCNHMTCKNQSCKFQYCWLCLGAWEPHGSSWYACNRFDDANAKAARDAQEKSRAALQRYLHYCNRYMNHMQSLKFENKLYAAIKTKMAEMQQHGMSWIEVQFLRKAVDVLCQCRRTLMYTYAFAYYLTKNNQSIIFETNQQDLEMATEQLSEFLERDLDKANLDTLKQNVQDKYRYCEQRRTALLDHCHEGDDKDWWKFADYSDLATGSTASASGSAK